MKTTYYLGSILLAIIISSCSNKTDFDDYIGTYVPLETNNTPLLKKVQIEKRGDLYILAGENHRASYGGSIWFFVCTKEKDHLSIDPAKYYLESENSSILLTEKTDLFFDKELINLYFLNTVYIPTNKKIFEVVGNKIIIK